MFEFWTHTALTIWSIIFTIIGGLLLIVILGLIAHEIFLVLLPDLFKKLNKDKDDS